LTSNKGQTSNISGTGRINTLFSDVHGRRFQSLVEPDCFDIESSNTSSVFHKKGAISPFFMYGGGSSLLRTRLSNFPCYWEIYREFSLFTGSSGLNSQQITVSLAIFSVAKRLQEYITGNLQGINRVLQTKSVFESGVDEN